MTVRQEGRAVNDLFSMLPICIFAKKITLDLFLDNSGFVSSMACSISMKSDFDFFSRFCTVAETFGCRNIPHCCHILKYHWFCVKIFRL